MSNGPLPSRRCLLTELPAGEIGDKVRFLGCVESYATKTALLVLKHAFPPQRQVKAIVDVNLLLQGLTSTHTAVGQWVHIVGYITTITKMRVTHVASPHEANVGIQALVLWSAEGLDVAAYERGVSLS